MLCCRASSAGQHIAAIPAPRAIRIATHPPGVGAIRPIVPPVVPLVRIEGAVAIEIAIAVISEIGVGVSQTPVDTHPHAVMAAESRPSRDRALSGGHGEATSG